MFLVLIACHGLTGTVAAQNFKVYTPVFDMKAGESTTRVGQKPQQPIVARSVLYFHANKAYDYIESEGEVLIYDPNAECFTVLHPGHRISTTLTFDELEKMVRDAEIAANKMLLKSREESSKQSPRAGMIEFQLEPRFFERYDRERGVLTLHSNFMTYEVKCVPVDNAERVQAYLRYCDWMARLNYVLHPQAPLPGPRLTLNESLRKYKMMPGEVILKASIGEGVALRAEHQIDWQFDTHARDRIHQWQTLLESDDIRKVSFTQFQEAVASKK